MLVSNPTTGKRGKTERITQDTNQPTAVICGERRNKGRNNSIINKRFTRENLKSILTSSVEKEEIRAE